MRRTFVNLSLLAVIAAPIAAHAATYDLTFTGTGVTYNYIVPSSTSTFSTDGSTFIEFSNVSVSKNGGAASLDTVDFIAGGSTNGGGLFDATSGLGILNPSTFAQLFTLFTSSTGFVTGPLTGFSDSNSDPTLTYSGRLVTAGPQSLAPEPSSLVLLGTGALGLVGSFRRRLLA